MNTVYEEQPAYKAVETGGIPYEKRRVLLAIVLHFCLSEETGLAPKMEVLTEKLYLFNT